MFTPQEVSEKVFPKAAFGSGGYSMASVDEFLDALTEDYTALFKENVTLKAKLKVLAEKVEEYRSTEDAMRQALLTAQKMAAKLVQDAQVEKEQILADARTEAQQEIHRLDDERQTAEKTAGWVVIAFCGRARESLSITSPAVTSPSSGTSITSRRPYMPTDSGAAKVSCRWGLKPLEKQMGKSLLRSARCMARIRSRWPM